MTGEKIDKLRQAGISDDILPVELENRTWGPFQYFTLWMGSVHNIPNYLAIGGLFALGIGVIPLFLAIMTAAVLLAIVLALNGHVGTKYGTPFSVVLIAIFGRKGATVIGVLRGIIAGVMWFGLQTFAGSQALLIIIHSYFPAFMTIGNGQTLLGLSIPNWITFILFWLIHISFLFGGMKAIGKFTNYLSPLVYIVFIGMAIWSVQLAGGWQAIVTYTPNGGSHFSVYLFLVAICAVIASWAAPIVSVADFSRLAKSYKGQVTGQSVGLIITYGLFAVASIAIIVGSEIAFGTPIWNVLEVIEKFDNQYAMMLAVLTLCLTTLSVNIVGNMVPAALQITALFPKVFRFQTAAILAAFVGICILPWRLMENETSIFAFLSLIGGMLGPVTGVMIAKYYFILQRKVTVEELYVKKELPTDYLALLTVGFSFLLSFSGKYIPFLFPLYELSWLTGVVSGFGLYICFHRIVKHMNTFKMVSLKGIRK